ncbi:MAG: alpha/beta hydrolase [Gemmatimonadetes bacterium]|nr:alpha/beta hydrolase [Gemmatimonadota bacterium]
MHGSGPPLLYVPGLDGTGLLFYRQVRALQHRFTVITPRLRDEARTLDALVADLRHHLDATAGAEPAVLVGESFGGALAMAFALAHPGRVRALVVLNSFPRVRNRLALRAARAATAVLPWGAMALVRRLTAFRLHSGHTHQDEVRRFLVLTARTTRTGYRNRLRMLTGCDLRARLPQLAVPTLFLAADRDRLLPSLREAREMARLVPGAVLQVLEGHGHSCFLAESVDLDAILRGWEGGGLVP